MNYLNLYICIKFWTFNNRDGPLFLGIFLGALGLGFRLSHITVSNSLLNLIESFDSWHVLLCNY